MPNLHRYTDGASGQLGPDQLNVPHESSTSRRFVVDAKASRFTVKALASGMSAGLGHSPTILIRDFQGDGEFDPERPDWARLTMKIRTGSLVVEDEMRDDDRCVLERIMRDEVLLIDRYQEIVFESSTVTHTKVSPGVYQVMLAGKLTIHDVTRKISFISLATLGAYNLRANGTFEIRQSDFGIKPVSIAGGSLTIQDSLKFGFFIVAKLQE